MSYLDDPREVMIALENPDDGNLLGILYENKFGAYVRRAGSWLSLAPDDESFDDTIPWFVKKETVQEFIDLFDKGGVTAETASAYLTSPDTE
jgi:hypothetical protein